MFNVIDVNCDKTDMRPWALIEISSNTNILQNPVGNFYLSKPDVLFLKILCTYYFSVLCIVTSKKILEWWPSEELSKDVLRISECEWETKAKLKVLFMMMAVAATGRSVLVQTILAVLVIYLSLFFCIQKKKNIIIKLN